MHRAERITRAVKSKDKKLFCAKNADGKLCVFRECFRLDRYVMDDGTAILFSRPDHHCVVALTHNWGIRGREVDWGLEPILARIDSLDLWRRDIARDIEIQEEKHLEACDRDLKNSNEAFLKDFRRSFAKATNDINTSSLAKTDLRKKKEKHAVNQ